MEELKGLRQETFLRFRKELKDDAVVIFKVLTSIDIPSLQEGLMLSDCEVGHILWILRKFQA